MVKNVYAVTGTCDIAREVHAIAKELLGPNQVVFIERWEVSKGAFGTQ